MEAVSQGKKKVEDSCVLDNVLELLLRFLVADDVVESGVWSRSEVRLVVYACFEASEAISQNYDKQQEEEEEEGDDEQYSDDSRDSSNEDYRSPDWRRRGSR